MQMTIVVLQSCNQMAGDIMLAGTGMHELFSADDENPLLH